MRSATLKVITLMAWLGIFAHIRAAAGEDKPLPKGLKIDLFYEYYEVEGSSAAELEKQMYRYGPKHRGEAFFGLLRWFVEWRYWFNTRGDSCAMDSVEVSVRATMILPKWQPQATVPDKLVAQWRGFIDALEKHEEGHYQHGVTAGQEVYTLLKRHRTRSCERMEKTANSLAGRIIDKYNRYDLHYDSKTNHGVKEGAVWPPRLR